MAMARHETGMDMDRGAHMPTPIKGQGPSERTTATSGIARRDDPSYLTAYVVLPGDLKMPISISGDSFRLPSEIQSSCKVYPECDGDDTAIRIIGRSPAYLQAAIKEINDFIRGLRTKEASGHQYLLVQPPNGPSYADGVILVHSNGASQEGSRPIFQPRGQELATSIPDFTPSCHEQKIADFFRDSMSTLQAMGCNLRMRANFGFLKLRQQRRAPPEYDLRQFVEISNRFPSRAVTWLDTSLRPGVDGSQIVSHFISSFSTHQGSSTSVGVSRDTYHTLTLLSPDKRIEATIIHAVDKDGVVRQRLANVEMFRRSWKRLDLISASPHMKHDWNIEVVVKEPVRPKPSWLDVLGRRVSLSAPSGEDAFSRSLRLKIGVIPELEGTIQTTILETSVSVRYPDTPYDVNVSATRSWPGTSTDTGPDPVCTISMRGVHWDERMTSVGSWKQGNRGPELEGVFAEGEASFRDGFVKFVQCVIRSQMILEEMDGTVKG